MECEVDTTIFEAARRALDLPIESINGFYIGEYIIKIKGSNNFILDDGHLPAFQEVRDDLNCKREPEFVFLPKDVVLGRIQEFFTWENVRLSSFSRK